MHDHVDVLRHRHLLTDFIGSNGERCSWTSHRREYTHAHTLTYVLVYDSINSFDDCIKSFTYIHAQLMLVNLLLTFFFEKDASIFDERIKNQILLKIKNDL